MIELSWMALGGIFYSGLVAGVVIAGLCRCARCDEDWEGDPGEG